MDFLTSFYNGISGVNAMSHQLNVTANNVANVNTSAFKAGQATFADRLDTAMGSVLVGRGVQLNSIGASFAAGSLENTSKSTDMALSGAGFFVMRDPDALAADRYTRNGEFTLTPTLGPEPNAYNLTSPVGQYVQGYNLSSSTVSPTVVSDILIKKTSPQSATTQVNLSINLEDNPELSESVNTPLFSSWDGRNSSSPIPADSYEYSTSIKIYGSDPGPTSANSLSDYLNIYFDSTANLNEKEFLVTCQPSLDQRLVNGSASRYSSASDKGAGALLYGILHFSTTGELNNIECWDIPPDGNVVPDPTSMLTLPRGESYFNFDYNLGGAAINDTSVINFGNTPRPQVVNSPTPSFSSANASQPINASSSWDSIFDSQGNKVKDGDIIRFQGRSGDGTPQDYSYSVDFTQSIEDLLFGLQNQFACKAEIINGTLTLTDTEVGASQLAIDSLSYANATGATPATATDIAEIFGSQGAEFIVSAESRYLGNSLTTTSYASPSAIIYQRQNGTDRGLLQALRLDEQGNIFGQYSNGPDIKQAQLVLANFNSLQGLKTVGGNSFAATNESGLATLGTPGFGGLGRVTNNTLEMSNVDLGREMTNLVMTQRAFQANSKSITTADEIYQDLLRLLRS
ncbi:MAG: flagellar hook-basal body complex protein [Proteobacteria bacterium]|nr:flagellar hook-basal body complex protein [Pseudomonadota bacterium]